MTAIDIAALILIALGTLHGSLRGLSGELAQLLSLSVAFIFGLWLHRPFAVWLLDNTRLGDRPAQALAFATTILSALIVMLCLRFVVRRIMKVVIEERFDRVCGAVSGLLRSSVVVAILFILLLIWPHDYLNRKFGEESLIGSFIRSQLTALGIAPDANAPRER